MALTQRSHAPLRNWAGNHTYRASALHRPDSLGQLRRLLQGTGSLHAVATRHSFTDLADAETLVSLDRLPEAHRIEIDREALTVAVGPAVTFAQLAEALNRHGLALTNLASLPHISVCGGVATATHGSGNSLGNLATQVCGMQVLTSQGEIVVLTADDPRLPGAAVHLGLLGLVLEVTLRVVPHYELRQTVYPGLSWESLLQQIDTVFALGRSVSVFHRFGDRTQAVWVKSDPERELPLALFDAPAATTPQHPLTGGDTSAATEQLGARGPWSERLPHFRSGFMPSAGAEIQSEVFIARHDARDALDDLRAWGEQLAPALLVGELRTVAPDELWLSPQYRRETLAIHFTWERDAAAVAKNVALIERVLAPYAIRPHWGKVFSLSPAALAAAYPQAAEFAKLRAEMDPRGTFINRWANQHVPFLLER